jgi:hypothetical protein
MTGVEGGIAADKFDCEKKGGLMRLDGEGVDPAVCVLYRCEVPWPEVAERFEDEDE